MILVNSTKAILQSILCLGLLNPFQNQCRTACRMVCQNQGWSKGGAAYTGYIYIFRQVFGPSLPPKKEIPQHMMT